MPESSLPVRLQRLALFNVCLGQFMSAVASRSVNVALPTLSVYFDASMAVVQWIPLAYQLTIVGLVLSMARMGAESRLAAVVIPLMLLGVGWALFQSPNLSGMFNAVAPRHVGAVSGLSLTAANIANATGVALGSVLFLRWLSFYGMEGVPPYTDWGREPALFIKSFQASWLMIAGLTGFAILTSALRGAEHRRKDAR